MKSHLYESLFKAHVFVFVEPTLKGVLKHLEMRGIDGDVGVAKAAKCIHIAKNGHDECLIWFSPEYVKGLRKGDPTAWSTVAHECHHAMCNIFQERGVGNDEEARSYLLDWLVENVGRKLISR